MNGRYGIVLLLPLVLESKKLNSSGLVLPNFVNFLSMFTDF
jgi:hypothetical protein